MFSVRTVTLSLVGCMSLLQRIINGKTIAKLIHSIVIRIQIMDLPCENGHSSNFKIFVVLLGCPLSIFMRLSIVLLMSFTSVSNAKTFFFVGKIVDILPLMMFRIRN